MTLQQLEYFLATILTTDTARTVPPFLASFVDGRGQFLAVLSAAATLAVLPVVAAGWLAQKQLVRGLAARVEGDDLVNV